MNVYELIDDLYHAHSYLRAGDDKEWPYMPVRQMLDAYAALAPDWANAPDWAQWYVIDADGEATLYAREPAYDSDGWHVIGVTNVIYCESVNLPLGIDWRLCKWSREGAA